MADDKLIVPVVIPSGSLHFATLPSTATIQDVQDYLVAIDSVKIEILGDLEPYGWATQTVRSEHNGRQWEEEELEALGNGPSFSASTIACMIMLLQAYCR
jgi:diaphanous 1